MPNIFKKILGAPKRALDAAMRRKLVSAVVVAILGAVGWQVSPEFQSAIVTVIDGLIEWLQQAPTTEQIPEALILLFR